MFSLRVKTIEHKSECFNIGELSYICSTISVTECLFAQSFGSLKKKVHFILAITALQEMITSQELYALNLANRKAALLRRPITSLQIKRSDLYLPICLVLYVSIHYKLV